MSTPYERKLKENLLNKFRKWDQLSNELNQLDITFDEDGKPLCPASMTLDEWQDVDFEYQCITTAIFDLQAEIEELLLNTRFFPLVGLTRAELKPVKAFSKTLNFNYEQIVDTFLTKKLEEHRDGMKARLKKIKYHTLPGSINSRIHYLYRQVISSYIFGNFESVCVLARTIAEGIAERYIRAKGYAKLLVGSRPRIKKLTIPGILKTILDVPIDVLKYYRLISDKADRVLHEMDELTEEKDALTSINNLHNFIRKFPRSI